MSEHASNKILGILRYEKPNISIFDVILSSENLLDDNWIVISPERQFTWEQVVEDYTNTPDITFLIVLVVKNLRSLIDGVTTLLRSKVGNSSRLDSCKIVVYELKLQRFRVSQKDISRADVTVDDSIRV